MSQQAGEMNINAVISDMGDPTGTEDGMGGNVSANTATPAHTAGNMSSTTTSKKATQETLFGPNIGLVSGGPSWAVIHEKKVVTDDLTPDVVKGWIAKSKQPSQPTTTLQALVNLKRPSLRLSPLSSDEPGSPSATDTGDNQIQVLSAHHLQLHGLEFEYDCDAPKCGLYVHVFVPKDHPEAQATVHPTGFSKILVFETVTEGGFGRLLKLEDGAILELGRFEQGRKTKPPTPLPASSGSGRSADAVSSSSGSDSRLIAGTASPTNGITEVLASVSETGENSNNNTNANNNNGRIRKRFSAFPFRRKGPSQGRSVAGPALAVVDMGQEGANQEHDGTAAAADGTGGVDVSAGTAARAQGNTTRRGKKKHSDESQGVRVLIRLAALDELGTELMSPNEQVTYLHIVRFGTKDPAVEEGNGEDTRPWVVKVVKREATIGPHTFHLHEIYGLTSSSSTHTAAPTAPLPEQEHSYPPEAPPSLVGPGGGGGMGDDSQSECLLCLSAPREVVLLPCRHLVACRECALNMVEFGAGGQITQPTEDSATAAGEAGAGGAGAEGTGGGEGGTGGTNAANTARRRRKAKGWYCPVCRQPYTSLLRITTHPPAPEKSAAPAKNEQGETDGVRRAADGVQNMSVADQQPSSGDGEEANEASRNTTGLGRMFRLGRRSANASAADENV
ncbi:hypothetical protein M378DRAFT_12362 [Amanita muscaria Koide BX008]|uniref:RING-type domain-containing protein n=1 Tax=Amanita muscaria (strain Koide BX008) TaxID=946122 RepID=A0A0C2X360_AMAMK|nr:hypothetical protein M378DRAFT_12362 [Amanita muscaria Koide BX008]